MRPLYDAFHLAEPTAYGALVAFGLWWGLVELVVQPVWHALSRRNERAADAFAARYAPAQDLVEALLKLRERSHLLPLSHPLYSLVYHSHPPLIERVERLGRAAGGAGPI
jgi:STE24 endopeptidase